MSKDKNELSNLRHTAAHLLAAALLKLYPDAKLAIGPSIEDGFYYDVDFGEKKVSEENFNKIEKKMRHLLTTWSEVSSKEVSNDEAEKQFENNPYKRELIEEITKKGEKITIYKMGEFEDLCRGGHSNNPKQDLKAFKLLSVAGAYWRGDEKNPMLTRIYGTAFPSQDELENHLQMLEEAKKRDHKKLGRQLGLFIFHKTSPGMAYWLPKGLTMYNQLYEYARKVYKKYNYQEVATPQLNKKELYETSGHWSHYGDDMFTSDMGENEVFGIKPMNCPNAMALFASDVRSYNDLPLRFAETSLLHRFELSGTLNGLFRTRQFRQDDAHIFLARDQVEEEFHRLLNMVEDMYKPFDLPYILRFGTRPEKFLGKKEEWDEAEKVLEDVLKKSGKEYVKVEGEGAFYGPKIDILMRDSLKREWQTGTIQLDFQQPQRFELKYTDQDGSQKMPVVFHRAIYGSFERFLAVLIEHYAGKLPLWLSPHQIAVLPVSEKTNDYAQNVHNALTQAQIRSYLDNDDETLGSKIRKATLQKVPFMCIIGEQEIKKSDAGKNQYVSVRTQDGKDLGQITVDSLIKTVTKKLEKETQL